VTEPELELGEVQQTLFIPLAARAADTRRRRPVLRDPKAILVLDEIAFDQRAYGRGWGGWITVLRGALFDRWVRGYLHRHPAGTVVELGTGLNTRFERLDNGQVHWLDVDLPDTIALRRRFFADSARRRMVAASFLGDEWQPLVEASPPPYCFVSEGMLVYLPEPAMARAVAGLARRFAGAELMLDVYSHRLLGQQHRLAERRGVPARWAWGCDDVRVFERLGLHLLEQVDVLSPPRELRTRLPVPVRVALPLVHLLGRHPIQLARFST
jgi:O-methyltransferase involved in polyketide biosynthesis